MPAIAEKSKTGLVASLQRARSSLANIREAAERGVRRGGIAVAAAGTAYATGRLHGWAEREGKDVNIPNTEVPWSAVGGAVLGLTGAFGSKLLGDTLADVTLGVGIGALDANATLAGYQHGKEPPK